MLSFLPSFRDLTSRFRPRAGRTRRRPPRQRKTPYRLGLETLEDRTLLTAGFLDPTFGPAATPGRVITDFFGANDLANAVAIQADGRIVVAGSSGVGSGSTFALARYNSDGSLDTSFDGDGRVFVNFSFGTDVARAVAIQADGRIVVAGTSDSNPALARCLGDPPLSLILDDGAAGFSTTGAWTPFAGQGFQNDVTFAAPGAGESVASWTFTGLTPGLYRVSATWSPHPNRATNAPYTVLDGSTPVGTVLINQELAPNDIVASGATFKNLGGPYQINSGTLVVRLTNNANEFVIADAVRIERLLTDPVRIIDDGQLGYFSTFTQAVGQGFQGDVGYAYAGAADNFTTWTFTGLQPGLYQVSATWFPHPNRATNSPFTVFNGTNPLATVLVNQELSPNDYFASGAGWRILGNFTITGDTLVVRLTNDADEFVIADAIRIERLA